MNGYPDRPPSIATTTQQAELLSNRLRTDLRRGRVRKAQTGQHAALAKAEAAIEDYLSYFWSRGAR